MYFQYAQYQRLYYLKLLQFCFSHIQIVIPNMDYTPTVNFYISSSAYFFLNKPTINPSKPKHGSSLDMAIISRISSASND